MELPAECGMGGGVERHIPATANGVPTKDVSTRT
jgi:hypothetical protein